MLRIYETVLYAPDVARAAAFYAETLELRLVEENDMAAVFRLDDDDGAVLLLFDPAQASQPGRFVPSHGAAGPGHVAFAVRSLEAWRDRLGERGVPIEREVDWKPGARSLYVRDPAGNSVELVEGDLWPA